MFRVIQEDLSNWKNEPNRKPLLIRGARQVGKTYVIEKFAKENFEQVIAINFELSPQFINCFENLEPKKILDAIELIIRQEIKIGHALLFLDEIQLCPKAILALRYFKEKLPELHVIGAGSFLEFVINDDHYQAPVGRVQSLYMKPCSFYEFLLACGDYRLVDYLSNVKLETKIDETVHTLLLEKCREYFIVGGMPEAVNYFVTQKKLYGCEKIQASILEYYQRDFAKYDEKINSSMLEKIFVKSPGLIAKRFKYVDIDPDTPSRDQKPALEALIKAGILYKVYHTSANGLPFYSGVSEKKFKLLHLDIGLTHYSSGIDMETLQHENLIMLNQGSLAEQFVGQELLSNTERFRESQLFYWEREKKGSSAEVDYVINVGPKIVPVEVKSGKTGRLKSLQVFLDEKKLDFGIRVSQHQFSFEHRILSIPLYMVPEIPRLIELIK